MRRLHRVVLALCIPVLLAGGLISLSQPARSQPASAAIHKVQGASWRPELGQPLFILVLGSDVRNGPPGGPGGRCDAIHIVAINPQARGGTILNIPRDSFVDVPGHGQQRINTACFFGGPGLMVTTIRNVTGIQVQYYAITEFSHFRFLIEELGGVDINIPYPMKDPVGSGADFEAGPRRVFGEDALRFNRNRHATPAGDFSRTENQGNFMLACLAKFRAEVAAEPSRMFDYIRVARRHTSITVPLTEMVKLGLLARDIDPVNLRSMLVPGRGGKSGAASVVFLTPGDIFDRVRDDALY